MAEAHAEVGESARQSASFAEAVRVWAKIGWLSFGDPAGQIALMHRELVERCRWISEPRFLHALNYCMLLPGPDRLRCASVTRYPDQSLFAAPGLRRPGLRPRTVPRL